MAKSRPAAVVAESSWADETEFAALAERYRRGLHVHCYRMLGSFDEAEDMVQETFLRGWRRRASYEGRATLRVWLYRIATNACLDFLRRNPRHAVLHTGQRAQFAEAPWLQPYPDRLLDEIAPSDDEPDAVVVARETIELGFLTTIQLLPPKQRALLILSDVLGWSPAEAASLLDTSPAAANSALQRARATMSRHRPPSRLDWTPAAHPTEQERALLQRYMDATDRSDTAAFVAVLHEGVRATMPPQPEWFEGPASMADMLQEAFGPPGMGNWRCVATWANRQPAAACYLRAPGESAYRALALDVLAVEDGKVVEITTFGDAVFQAFGLPATL